MKSQNHNGKINVYQSPIFEVLEIAVEQGFATSGNFSGNGFDYNENDNVI